MRVLLLPRTEGKAFTLLVLIGVGSRYEKEKQSGLSHFLEHMFFKGTRKRSDKLEIAETLDNMGAEYNAFTGEEVTGYYVKAAQDHLDLAGDVVADILLNSVFPSREIERERGVIMEEIKMHTDAPMRHVNHLWRRALFGGHPLGRRVDGTPETVARFTRNDFLNYTGCHYHTGNTVVVVAGNFRERGILSKIEGWFRGLPRGKETKPERARAGPTQRLVFENRSSLDQTHLIVGVPGTSLRDERRWATEVLAVILGGGMSSRLFMEVRENKGLAYSLRTSSENLTDTGGFETQAGLRTDKAGFALKLILRQYDRIMQEAVAQAEIDKARQMIKGRLALELEETNSLAVFAGMQELLQKKVMTPDDIERRILSVTAREIQSTARALLRTDQRAVAVLGPQSSPDVFEQQLRTG